MGVQSSRKVVLLAFALALGATGCASGGGGGPARPAGATTNRIVLEEIQALGQVSALQAIERLRPRWLQSRAGMNGDPPVLYVDGARRGSAASATAQAALIPARRRRSSIHRPARLSCNSTVRVPR